ncbi:hypothetical protein M1295_00030 [Patescibacteria group bacterium]|nr:hypothetical protein [Patescibacteria group bacterium]
MDGESKVVGALGGRKKIIFWSVIVIVVIAVILYVVFGILLRQNIPSYVTVANMIGGPGATTTTVVKQSIPTIGVITQDLVPIEKMADTAIDITSVGFSPSAVTIKQGGSVIWTVRDKNTHWIISTSTNQYPESGSCGSALNSCGAIGLGQSFRMVFNKTGTWNYYDKLHPQFTGTVVVQ